MKLESIAAFPIGIKTSEDLRGGTFRYTHYQSVLVRAAVQGVEGWGEAMTRSDPKATALLVRYLAKEIVGGEFETPREVWRKLWDGLRVRGHTRGVDVEALSGIEISLQDCVGKIRRRPLAAVYSKKPLPRVRAFAGSLFESRGTLEAQVETAKQGGLSGAKVKIGFGVEKDRTTLEEFRRRWPEGMLVADANGAYDGAGAKKACRAFRDLNLDWFEEPVLSDDLEGYASLRGSGVTIGAGESWFAGDFARPIKERLIGVLEPSVSRCGGFEVALGAASLATKAGLGFSPMTGMNSAVSLAASIQAASVCGTVGVEYNPFPNPLQADLASGLEQPREGAIEVPRGDGLGIEVDFRYVKAHEL